MPERVAVDTGPLVALMDRGEAHHERAVEFVRNVRGRLVTNLAVIAEAMHLLDFDLTGQTNLLTFVNSGALTLIDPAPHELERVSQLMRRYADRPMDFADALLVAMCERLGITTVASIDLDFSIYRLHGRKAFRNVFWDNRH